MDLLTGLAPLVLFIPAALIAGCSNTATAPATAVQTSVVLTTLPPPVTSTTTTLPPTTVAPTTSSTSTTLPPTTTTTTTINPIVTEGGIVLVANAAGLPGAGAKMTKRFFNLGYVMRDPINAAGSDEQLDVSRVYFLEEGRAVAISIAHLMGDVAVIPMPTPPPMDGAVDGLGDANVLVMLGADLAGKKLPNL